jgi:isopentenyldiphosphate isomerase
MQLTIYTYFQCSVHKGLTLNGTLQIDYVLFVTVPSKDLITIRPHPDEVDDVRWVTQDTLLRCSPWFCLIAAG